MTSPAGQLLGNAHGKVDIDASGVTTSLDQAKAQFNNFIQSTGQSMQQWGNQIRNIGFGLSAAMAPAGLAFNRGIEIASDFDSAMTEIQARTGLTAEAMKEIEQAAIDTGAASVFSSQQVADAFLQMLTAGLDTEAALATLPAVVNAAAAGNIDLGRAADLATNVMSVFNLTADDTGDIIDAIVRASASSPASFGEMGEAMQRAGGQAKRFGLDVNETSAALAILANNGIRGSEAGTAFNSMLRNVSRDTPGVTAAWEELGVTLYDAQGNVRDLDLVFGELEVALAKLPVEDQNRLIQELAGSEGAAAFNALLLSDGIGAMQEQMAGQASAAEVAAAQMDTYKQTVNSLAGSIETAAIAVFTPFMNKVLKPQLKQMIEHVNAITKWASENEELVIVILRVVKALITLGPALVIAGMLISGIGSAIGFILSPMTLLIATIGLLTTAFIKDFMGIRSAIMPLIEWLADFFSETIHSIRLFISTFKEFGLGEAIMSLFGKGRQAKGSILRGWLTGIGFSRKEAIAINKEVLGVFTQWFPKFNNFFIHTQRAVASWIAKIRATFTALFKPISAESFNNLLEAGFSRETAENILRTIRDIRANIERFVDRVQAFMFRLRVAWQFGLKGLAEFDDAIAHTGSVIRAFGHSIGMFLRNFATTMGLPEDSAWALYDAVYGVFSRIDNIVKRAASSIAYSINFIREAFSILIYRDFQGFGAFAEDSNIANFFFNLRDRIVDTFTRIRDAVGPALKEISTFISNNIGKIIQLGMAFWSLSNPINLIMRLLGIDLLSIFETVMGAITDFFATLNQGGSLSDAFVALFGNSEIGQQLVAGFTSIATFIQGTIIPAFGQFSDWFLVTALPAIVNFITGVVIPSVGGFFTFLSNLWTIVGPSLMFIAEWFLVTALPAIISAIGQLIDWLANTVHLGEILANVFQWIANNIAVVLIPILAGLAVAFAPTLAIIGAVIGAIWLFAQAWENNFLGIRTGIEWFVANLPIAATAFSQLVQIIMFGLELIWAAAQIAWRLIVIGLQAAATTATQIWEIFKIALIALWESIKTFFTDTVKPIWDTLVATMSTIWELVQPHIQAIWDGIVNIFSGILTWITTNWDTAWSTFTGFFSGLWSAVSTGIDAFKTGIQTAFNWVKTNVIDPIITAVQNLINMFNDAIGLAGDVANAAGNLITNPGEAVGQATSNAQGLLGQAGQIIGLGTKKLFGFADGINLVPQVTPALLHPGEAVIPAQYNPFNPNAEKPNGGGGNTYQITVESINASGYQEGVKAGEGFADGFERKMRNNGVNLSS